MSITPFLTHRAFDPETVEIIASAFDKICADLGLSTREDRLTELVARHVIDAAQMGMRDEAAIRLSVLHNFKSNTQ